VDVEFAERRSATRGFGGVELDPKDQIGPVGRTKQIIGNAVYDRLTLSAERRACWKRWPRVRHGGACA